MQAWMWIITGFEFLWAVFFLMLSDALSRAAHGSLPPPALDVVGSGVSLLLGGTLLYYLLQLGHRPDAARTALILAAITAALSALAWWFWPSRRH